MPEDKKDSSVKTNCTIFLGYTSNMISCGMREYIRFLVQHKMVSSGFWSARSSCRVAFSTSSSNFKVDCLVCTAGGIEEDFIKCLAPTLSGDFNLSGSQLRTEGINRIGNLLVPNDNYCKFEDWITPIFDKMVSSGLFFQSFSGISVLMAQFHSSNRSTSKSKTKSTGYIFLLNWSFWVLETAD